MNIDFLYLKGNHDSDNFLNRMEEIPENLLLFEDTWKAYRYGNIVISGVELTPQNRAIIYNSLVLNHDDYNIVTLHGQIGGYYSKNETENISLNDLKNKNIDTLINDHYLDSLSILSLISELEDEFDIVIPTVEIIPDNFNSVKSMMALINKLKEED